MPRHGQVTAVDDTWTDIFKAAEANGEDGPAARGMLLGVPADAVAPVMYRWRALGEDADDFAAGAGAQLNPGDYAPMLGSANQIVHVQAKGVGDDISVQLEETIR